MGNWDRWHRNDERDRHDGRLGRNERGGVRIFSKDEIAQLKNTPTRHVVAPPEPPTRSAADQVAAMLKLTDRQLRNLELAGQLSDAQVSELGKLASIVRLCLAKASPDQADIIVDTT